MSIVNYPLMAAGFLLDLYENESIRRQSRHVCDCDYSIQMSQRISSAWSLASLRFMVLLRHENNNWKCFSVALCCLLIRKENVFRQIDKQVLFS